MPRTANVILAEIEVLVTELAAATMAGGDCEKLVNAIAALQAVYRDKCNGGV